MAEKLDGLGLAIDPDAEYYVQDARGVVGNCVSWWRPHGKGYCCELQDAGVYTGEQVRSMRDTDVPWPVAHVRAIVVHHVRGEHLRQLRSR